MQGKACALHRPLPHHAGSQGAAAGGDLGPLGSGLGVTALRLQVPQLLQADDGLSDQNRTISQGGDASHRVRGHLPSVADPLSEERKTILLHAWEQVTEQPLRGPVQSRPAPRVA